MNVLSLKDHELHFIISFNFFFPLSPSIPFFSCSGCESYNTINTKSVWAVLKLATVQYCLGDQRSTAQSLVECVGKLERLGESKEGTEMEVERLTIPTSRLRHCRFIPLTRSAVLSYCCKLLTCLLQERALQPGVQGDMAMGHTITIMQYNWPDNRELFYHLLNRVRGREGFSYPLFCQ